MMRKTINRRTAVCVRSVRQIVFRQGEFERPSSHPHERETVPLPTLRPRFRAQRQITSAYENSHGRASASVHRLRQNFYPIGPARHSHALSHR